MKAQALSRFFARPTAWLAIAAVATALGAGSVWWRGHAPGRGPIRIGYRDQPPFYVATPDRPAGGIAVDILAAAAARLGIDVRWTRITGASDAALRAGAIDVWPTFPVEAGGPDLHATDPWLESTFVLVARSGALRDGADVAGRSVAVFPVRYAEAMFASALRGATQVVTPAAEQSLQAVCSGAADAALIEARQVQWLLLSRPAGCGEVPLAFYPAAGVALPYAVGSTVAAAPYADALRAEISRMSEDGTLGSIHSRWSPATENEIRLVYALQQARQTNRLSLVGGGAVTIALVVSLWLIRRTVHARRLAEVAKATMADYAHRQERYRLLFERNLAGVVQTSVDGRILDCNDAFARMVGYEAKEELLAVPAWQLYMDQADRQAVLARMREEKAVANLEIHIRRRDGSSGWLLESANLIDQGPGQPAILESTTIDITEQRRLEEHYRQAQKLESIGRLAGGVAHDFNNLLTAITGYAELALAELDGRSSIRESLEEIRKAGERAASLTQQLLAFSRKQLLQPTDLSLNDVVSEVQQLLQRVIGKDIALLARLDPSLGLVRADPGQLHQVVMNLAMNARDAMPGGGTITLETRNVVVSPAEVDNDPDATTGPCARLTVRDTGTGMDEDTRRRVFEPFFTTKGLGQGTGLGLSTVYGIVKQSGGSIVVRSAPGEGAVFEVDLPLVARPAEGGLAGRPSGVPRAHTVLVVEAIEEVRRLATESLSRSGFRVLAAGDALGALDACARESRPVHLLVVDLVMPGLSGPALAERLATDYPSLKVIFLAGHRGEALGGETRFGASAEYLHKPFTPAELVQTALGLLRTVDCME